MPSYSRTVRSPWSPERAFDYLADLTNFTEWDPGTVRVAPVPAGAHGHPASDVTVKTFGRELTLRYEIVERDPPRHLLLRAETSTLRLVDEITIVPTQHGSVVTYDATLTLRGPLRLAGPLFAPGFRRTVDRGAAGLTTVLEGVPA